MVTCDDAVIEKMVLHKVGNKLNNEPLKLSPAPFALHGDISNVLLKYFTTHFKSSQTYRLFNEIAPENNFVYGCVKAVFDNPDELYEQSVNIAKYLYEVSEHPNIKSGELYITLLQRCFAEGEVVRALGIFKSENKETYLKVFPSGDGFEIESELGININRLDKGCIIYDKEAENGYIATVADMSARGGEAAFWMDDFLSLRQRPDSFYNTEHTINVCKSFVSDYLPSEYEMDKADQAELLNKTANYLKENKQFDLERFNREVMEVPELQDSFKEYRDRYRQEYDVDLSDNFILSEQAMRKGQRVFKSVLKLDRNFTIYIHGSRSRVEKGVDEKTGLQYYKFLYDEEK